MTKYNSSLFSHAMRYGTYLGIYWIMKFFFVPLSVTIPIFQLFFIVSTLFSPCLALMYSVRYKNKYCGGEIPYMKAVLFNFLLFVFAALLTTSIHFIYFQFVDHNYLYDHLILELDRIDQGPYVVDKNMMADFRNLLTETNALSPIRKTAHFLIKNIYLGFLLSWILAFLTKVITYKSRNY